MDVVWGRVRTNSFKPKNWQRAETTSWRFRRKSLLLSHAPDTARTCNLQFRRLSLYPVELRVLYIAEFDHMAQPGFGKAKMQSLKPGDRIQEVSLRLRLQLETLCNCGCTDRSYFTDGLLRTRYKFQCTYPMRTDRIPATRIQVAGKPRLSASR